jgi:TolB-like protein
VTAERKSRKKEVPQKTSSATTLKGGAVLGAAGLALPGKSGEKARELKEAKKMVGKQPVKVVGEPMAVAIFPFQVSGTKENLGAIVQDKLITALFHQKRFRVIERSQLDRILEEQKLGMSGLLDASTAAELGKGIGVDAIIIGSTTQASNGSISIDARAIDTESATIIVANDAYSASNDSKSMKTAIENLAYKFVQSLPLIDGYVINVANKIMIDKGLQAGIRKGQKCTVYTEGKEVKHPITGQILGKETIIKGEILVTGVYEKYSYCIPVMQEPGTVIKVGDRFVTK